MHQKICNITVRHRQRTMQDKVQDVMFLAANILKSDPAVPNLPKSSSSPPTPP